MRNAGWIAAGFFLSGVLFLIVAALNIYLLVKAVS